MEKRRVVITGAGALTPIGRNAPESWAAARAGVCGVAPITLYDAGRQKVRLAAEVKHFVPEDCIDKRDVRKLDRFAQFALAAAAEAMTASGLNAEREDPARCGVLVSSGIGGLSTLEREIQKGVEKGFERISPFYIPMTITNLAAGHIAIRYGFQGMCACPAAACAGGSNAVGDAFRHIRDGYAEVMLCGGAEAAITPSGIGGFTSMHALTLCPDPERASIPFDAERSGFVMGEGAGILLLEELSHAQRRGADILAEVVGYGATCDAHHITAPAPGRGGSRRLHARRPGGCRDRSGAGGLSQRTRHLHPAQRRLRDRRYQSRLRPSRPAPGHQLHQIHDRPSAGGLRRRGGALYRPGPAGRLPPPTIHYQKPDPACDLDVVPNAGWAAGVEYAMSNSLGFGGHNVSLLLRRWEGCAWN